MYLCGICGACSEPRQSRLVHYIYRTIPVSHYQSVDGQQELIQSHRKEIQEEVPVCKKCNGLLQDGVSLERVQALVHIKTLVDETDSQIKRQLGSKQDDWKSQAIPVRGSATNK